MDNGSVAILATSTLTFLGTIAKMLYDIFTKSQERRWAQEDADRLADKVAEHGKQVMAAIDENTTISKSAAQKADAAYVEANNVNQKIADLGERLNK